MRQVLFRIPVLQPLDLGPLGQWMLFGMGVLTALWILAALVWLLIRWRKRQWTADDTTSLVFMVGIAAVLAFLPTILPRFAPDIAKLGIPIFGYGVMLFVGIVLALGLASWRSEHDGISPEVMLDLVVWLVVSGIIGGRMFFLLRYWDETFADKTGASALFAAINLSSGGLVLHGAILGGVIALFLFCYRRRLNPWRIADIIMPSVFVGIAIGRIGCLLNGCCFGGICELPWAIQFPADSVPFQAYVARGFIPPDAPASPPLHPTQIYSTIDGLVIACVLLAYSPYKRRVGDIFGAGLLMYGITRFLVELLRSDEVGLFGTWFTGGQWISLMLIPIGIAILTVPQEWLRGPETKPLSTAE